jgi:hypothetical protein
MQPVIHIAGPHIQVGPQLRQRCAWCGGLLIDYNLALIAVSIPEGKTEETMTDEERRPGTWQPGGLVAVDGNAQWTVEHEDGAELPDGACGKLDPEATA